MGYPNYSVLMSVYCKEKAQYLEYAIQSMLDQTISPNEFILIKDGPLTKELDLVIERFVSANPGLFNIIVNENNIGLGPALAKGVIASSNELIARMDSDDFVVENRVEQQLKIFESDSSLGVVGSFESEFIDNIDNVVSVHRVPEKDDEIKKFMRRRCAVLHPTVILKKSDVLASGNYHDVRLYEDYDLFARMIFEHDVKCYNIQDSLYYIRTSEDFFERRGGYSYAKTALKFKWTQFRKGHMSFADFFISGIGQFVVSCLPNKVRKIFYMKVLRG